MTTLPSTILFCSTVSGFFSLVSLGSLSNIRPPISLYSCKKTIYIFIFTKNIHLFLNNNLPGGENRCLQIPPEVLLVFLELLLPPVSLPRQFRALETLDLWQKFHFSSSSLSSISTIIFFIIFSSFSFSPPLMWRISFSIISTLLWASAVCSLTSSNLPRKISFVSLLEAYNKWVTFGYYEVLLGTFRYLDVITPVRYLF